MEKYSTMHRIIICSIIVFSLGMQAMIHDSGVVKKVLSNGLTILVRPSSMVPKVAVQLFYKVGSKDEKSGQRGLAHLIEHMIFKGTTTLSESDINLIANKLSGYINAFTSYDYTGYLFELPSQHWYECMPILADCMRNCTFKQELLNSEMKAVIQELKMYHDDYASTLIEHMVGTIFADHPYHYPIIGFKQDLWSVSSQVLHDFYAYHYVPNNAVLVVAGDVNPEDAFALAERNFGAIPANPLYKHQELYHAQDIEAKRVVIHRDLKDPMAVMAFEVPGSSKGKDYVIDVAAWLLGGGKSSRLYKKIVDDLQLATSLSVFTYNLFDYGLFFIYYQPKNADAIKEIERIIHAELAELAKNGPTYEEIMKAAKQNDAATVSLLENLQKQVDFIGRSYLAMDDKDYLVTYLQHDKQKLVFEVQELIKRFMKASVAHGGAVLPLDADDKELWLEVQNASDAQDARILSQAAREAEVEQGKVVHSIAKQQPKKFDFPKATTLTLPSGLKVHYYHNANVPKVDIMLTLKAKHYYDPQGKEGRLNFVDLMIQEGTTQHPGHSLAEEFERRGMSFDIRSNTIMISCLSEDVAVALSLLSELVMDAQLPAESLEKVRAQIKTSINNFWDEPNKFIGSLARKEIYQEHPYARHALGTLESISRMSLQDIHDAYRAYFVPEGAHLAIVGDLQGHDIAASAEGFLGEWEGAALPDVPFPAVAEPAPHIVNYPINRDQVVLAYAGKSVHRFDPDFDALLLFDQIFTGGVLGSMSSRLFALRERSGLFYTIGGSLLSNVDKEPGMIYLRTIVSKDRLEEAEQAIEEAINTAANEIEDEEFEQARDALVNSLVESFESNKHIAGTFIALEQLGLPASYFDTRAEALLSISKEEVLTTIKPYLSSGRLVKLRAGRV